jgi:ankyrin repeat protein
VLRVQATDPHRAPTQAPDLGPALSAALGVSGDGGEAGERLRAAARKGDMPTIKCLLSDPEPPPVDARDPATQRTALMEAAQHGHYNVVQSLMHRRADVTARDLQGCTPLILAARFGFLTEHHERAFLTVNALFSKRRRLSLPTLDAQDAEGFTALMHAASNGNKRVVELLLSMNAKRDVKNNQGQTAWDLTTCPEIKSVLEVGQTATHDARSLGTAFL